MTFLPGANFFFFGHRSVVGWLAGSSIDSEDYTLFQCIFKRSIYESSLSVGKRSRGLRSNDEWQGTFSGSTYNRKLASLLNLFSLLRMYEAAVSSALHPQ